MRSVKIILMMGIMLITASALYAQNVNVTVDGRPIQFTGVGPQMVQGRVLVPFRGVLEELGAFVQWIPESRTVVAQRGNRLVVLQIGSRTATVSGETVTLDVPATITAGTTMVPLRFLSEALGADVRWNAAARTVEITTGGAQPQPQPPTEQVQIQSFTHNATGWLTIGDTLEVTLIGTRGGTAMFEVPGVVDRMNMTETSPGRYVGRWTVPSGNRSIQGATVLGQLRVGGIERLIQAGNPVNVDTVPPEIRNLLPEPNATAASAQPNISAVYDDSTGSGINQASVRMTVNGTNVTPNATVTQSFISYRPPATLPTGQNTVTLTVNDQAGNTTTRTWNFTVRGAASVIRSFTHNAAGTVNPGDVITVTMQAEPSGSASFSFVTTTGQRIRTTQMRETSSGVYVGEYTVRRDDIIQGATVVGTFTTSTGQSYTVEADRRIGGGTTTLTRPVITRPTEGAAVTSPLTITGTAPANSQVRLRVDYVTRVLGAINLTGTLTNQVVDVNSRGQFSSEPISLGTLVGGRDTEYTLTATTIGASGQESEPAVVRFTRQ